MTTPRPFLKWVGGKTQLLPSLLDRVPATMTGYHEPFLGGGALFFELARLSRLPKRVVLSDINPDLVTTWRGVRDDPAALADALDAHQAAHDEGHYYAVRSARPIAFIERAARFIYINKAGFNGLWRVNKKGEFNVPFGHRKTVRLYDRDNLLACSRALQDVEIRCRNFIETETYAKPGDFVYFDPPYAPLSATSDFTSYTAEGFDVEDQRRLAQGFGDLADRGVSVLLSNSSAPLILDLYAKWKPELVYARRAVNCDGTKRGPVPEVLVATFQSEASPNA